jgi:THUMP domain-like
MDIDRARYLVSNAGREALASAPSEYAALDPNQLAAALRRGLPAGEAAALAEQIVLREGARTRFGEDLGILLTADGLQMMTHPVVARRRAARLASLGLPVADLTCGLGGDLVAVVQAGVRAAGLDHEAATAILAAANVPGAAVIRADATRAPVNLGQFAVIIDPSRRTAAGRRFDPAAFTPRWDLALQLLGRSRSGVLKAPPGIEHSHVPPEAEVEFVQLGRSMREASLWLGAGTKPGLRRAVLLPSSAEIVSTDPEAPAETADPGLFLFDPESCVTLAGLVRHLGARLGARLMDRQVAYLTAGEPVFDPLCATFEVLDRMPFSISRLKARMRERCWKAVEIRRRAFPIEPDELRRLLGRLDGDPVTLLLTTIAGARTVFAVRRLFPG